MVKSYFYHSLFSSPFPNWTREQFFSVVLYLRFLENNVNNVIMMSLNARLKRAVLESVHDRIVPDTSLSQPEAIKNLELEILSLAQVYQQPTFDPRQ